MSRPRDVKGLDPQFDLDLTRALRQLRVHFGNEQVVVLTCFPNDDRARMERTARVYLTATLFDPEESPRA
jgi:hypothetical protein